jgi:LPXTG-site transpeptidase (sortase) family protein
MRVDSIAGSAGISFRRTVCALTVLALASALVGLPRFGATTAWAAEAHDELGAREPDDASPPASTMATLTVVTLVINNSGGISVASDFNVHVTLGGRDVSGSPAPGAESPGTVYRLAPGRYAISQDETATYRTSFQQDGDAIAEESPVAYVALGGGQDTTVTIVNNDIVIPQPPGPFGLTKSADPAAGTIVTPGQTIGYRLAYANSGVATVTGVVIRDVLGPGVAYQPGTLELDGVSIPDAGHYDPATRAFSVAVGSVAPGANGALTFKVTVGPWSESRFGMENQAMWTAGDNTSGSSEPVYHYVDSLDVSKTVSVVSGDVVRTGSVLQWNIVVANRGIRPATNVVVTDVVPDETSYLKNSMSFHNSADDSDAPTIRWNIDAIDVGESVRLTFKSKVKDTVADGAVISNSVSVRCDQGPVKLAGVQAPPVEDAKTIPAQTAGAESVTLGLIGLLCALAVGLVSSRRGSGARKRRVCNIMLSVVLGSALVTGGLEVGAAFGLPSPGEAVRSAVAGAAAARSASKPKASAATVSIPRLGLRARLVEGRSTVALAKGVWRQPTSVAPGKKGATVIAGHRVSSQFRRLNRVRAGDTVYVKTKSWTFKYRVASVSTRKAGRGLYFRRGVREKLILYTCVPRWQGDKRTVVVCYPTKK